MKILNLRFMVMLACIVSLTGWSSAYYGTLEKVGIHKRDLMVDRVEDARDAQEEAKEQFQSALEQFTSVVTVKGGDLEKKYIQLNDAYEASEKKAEVVHDRIEKVEDVSEALFDEWEDELALYSSPRLREDSRKKLEQTRSDYKRLIKAMKRAEKKIQPRAGIQQSAVGEPIILKVFLRQFPEGTEIARLLTILLQLVLWPKPDIRVL